jgi:hypothetical protein
LQIKKRLFIFIARFKIVFLKMIKNTEKLYNGQCRVCFYINPKYKKMLKEQSFKHGSLSKVCSDIIKQHFKAYK